MIKSDKHLFLQGKFKVLQRRVVENTKIKPTELQLGALVFLGQNQDAEIYFEKWMSEYSKDEQALVLFFLAVGRVRSSSFEKAQKYLMMLFQIRNQLQSAESKVYIFQAFGFYRHFICRYKKSFYWAQKAWRQAVLADSELGKFLSCDLWAHALFQLGEIEQGFSQLQKAKSIAKKNGQGALVESLEVSKMIYQAQFGINPQNQIAKLQNKIKKLKTDADTYTKANLGLELARQCQLRGHVVEAEKVIESIQPFIFKNDHRRQRSQWYFRKASILYDRNLVGDALNTLIKSEGEIDIKNDLAHRLQILGLRSQILNERNQIEKVDLIQNEIKKLTSRMGSGVSLGYWQRIDGKKTVGLIDPLGDLMDEISKNETSSLEVIQKIVDRGYFGLLRKFLPSRHNLQIVIGHLPSSVTVVDHGEIRFRPQQMTELLIKLIQLLSEGPQSKDDIVKKIWGYHYEAYRHDPLVHAALVRLRKALGMGDNGILFSKDKYFLRPGVQVTQFHHTKPKINENLKNEIFNLSLNYRQIKILTQLRSTNECSIRDLMFLLNAKKITVNRDLVGLLQMGLIIRSGQGKASRYHLATA